MRSVARGVVNRSLVAFFLVVGFGAVANLSAAPLQRNLGDGLAYFRLHALPGDLPPDTMIEKHPAVIDVRFVKADASAATVFDSWLRFHATRQHPIFVLANTATSTAILSALREASEPAVMTIGIAGHHFSPSISVESSAAEEKRAYQALDDGATVASLITDHPDKQRNDEASLTKPPPVDGDLAPTPDEPTEAKTPATEPPVDAALQRAVQLFRGLKALKAL